MFTHLRINIIFIMLRPMRVEPSKLSKEIRVHSYAFTFYQNSFGGVHYSDEFRYVKNVTTFIRTLKTSLNVIRIMNTVQFYKSDYKLYTILRKRNRTFSLNQKKIYQNTISYTFPIVQINLLLLLNMTKGLKMYAILKTVFFKHMYLYIIIYWTTATPWLLTLVVLNKNLQLH